MRSVVALLALVPWAGAAAPGGFVSFEKIASVAREAEPVTFGMPFPRGVLRDAGAFQLVDGGEFIPVQSLVTGEWPDGSVRWLLVRALVDLPANDGYRVEWRLGEGAGGEPISLQRREDGGVRVDSGALAATVAAGGGLLRDVEFHGRGVPGEFGGFEIRHDGGVSDTADAGGATIEVLEHGPVAVVVRVSGRHGKAGSPFDYTADLTFWAGKPYVAVDYRVLLARGDRDVQVESWQWSARLKGHDVRLRASEGATGEQVQESTTEAAVVFGEEDFLYGAVEHEMQSYWGDFWADWRSDTVGLAVTARQAQQNFPKRLAARPDGVRLWFYPESEEALEFPFGAAKSHEMLLHFHAADAELQEIKTRSLQYQIPDVALLDPEWYRECEVWDDRLLPVSRSRRIDALVLDAMDNRPVGLGIWNFGDEVEWGYTGQGRGQGEMVWLNNEYDFAHHLFLYYARSGERRLLDYAAVNARHWRDVDIAHVSRDPQRRGGHIAHSARHVTGGVSPSHQWVEGLFDAWHMLGDRHARDAAVEVGENILRAMAAEKYADTDAQRSTRDMGWAMRALLAMYRETGEERYVKPAHEIVERFQEWHERYPGLLAPYTSHSRPRVVFMNSLTLVSLARYQRKYPHDTLETLILEETDELIEHGRNATGLFYYKELPSLKFQGAARLILQLLAEAYRLSGDKRYLEVGLPQLEHLLYNMNGRILVHTGAAEKFVVAGGGYTRVLYYPIGGKSVGPILSPVLEFLEAAKETGIPEQLDWRLQMK